MNRENLLRVADAIEKHEIKGLGFNMVDWLSDEAADRSEHHCGTTACLRGWGAAVMLARVPNYGEACCTHICDVENFLGLSSTDSQALFIGGPSGVKISSVTPKQAVSTLRYAASHGVIDWDAANAEPAS